MNPRMAVVLIALLVIGTLGGISLLGNAETDHGAIQKISVVDFDGENPPTNPDAIPGGDPEHPK